MISAHLDYCYSYIYKIYFYVTHIFEYIYKIEFNFFEEFANILQEKLLLINGTLSEDITDITRAWPLQLKNKDSR